MGEGLRVTARSVGDDLPEAVEGDGGGWLLGVQWHPEADPGSGVIAALVGAAQASIGERAWTEEKGATPSTPPLTVTNGADPVGSALHPARTPSLDGGGAGFLGRAYRLAAPAFRPGGAV